MASLTESNKRYIGNMQRAGLLQAVDFQGTKEGYSATVTTKEGTVHKFYTSKQWNDWWDARCPRVPVGFNPLG